MEKFVILKKKITVQLVWKFVKKIIDRVNLKIRSTELVDQWVWLVGMKF